MADVRAGGDGVGRQLALHRRAIYTLLQWASAMQNDQRPAVEPPPATGEGGVDLTLIRWMLSLTPAQRLDVLQDFVDSVQELRRGRGR